MGERISSPNKPNEKKGWKKTLSGTDWNEVTDITEKALRQISAFSEDLETDFAIRFKSTDSVGIEALGNMVWNSDWMADVMKIESVWIKGSDSQVVKGDYTI